jgi:hypothetical protein
MRGRGRFTYKGEKGKREKGEEGERRRGNRRNKGETTKGEEVWTKTPNEILWRRIE